MAVTLGNPYRFTAATDTYAGKVNVRSIRWAGTAASPIAADDDLVIHDSAGGNVVFTARAAANAEVHAADIGWVDGIYITTLDHGEVEVFVK